MEPPLGTDLTARQVCELILPVLVDAGLEATCESLVNFLTITLMQPSSILKEPWTLQSQDVKAGYVPGPMSNSYRREHVLYRDLHALHP
jgi:hypothetical protein